MTSSPSARDIILALKELHDWMDAKGMDSDLRGVLFAAGAGVEIQLLGITDPAKAQEGVKILQTVLQLWAQGPGPNERSH